MRLDKLTPERLTKAIRIYCDYAYGRDTPEHIPRVGSSSTLRELLDMMLDESVQEGAHPHHRYALRLGSRDYPYMKLVLEECFYNEEYFFLVDTHDEIDLDPNSPDYRAWLALRNLNRKVKEAVESAWWAAELATLRSLRERLIAEGGIDRAGSREEVILLVEDEDALSETLSLAMARHGFASLRASSPAEAAHRGALAAPDCIVVNAFVGGLPGREICTHLKAVPELENTPIVLLTTRTDFLKRDAHADAHVLTPVDEGVLFRTIDHLLERARPAE